MFVINCINVIYGVNEIKSFSVYSCGCKRYHLSDERIETPRAEIRCRAGAIDGRDKNEWRKKTVPGDYNSNV